MQISNIKFKTAAKAVFLSNSPGIYASGVLVCFICAPQVIKTVFWLTVPYVRYLRSMSFYICVRVS